MVRASNTPVYGIAVAASLIEVPVATLRLLEAKGVLTPSRSDGGTRRYSDDDITRLVRAIELRDAGVNFVGIRHILEVEDENERLRSRLDE